MEYSKNKFACELLDGQIQDDIYKIIGDNIYYKGRIYLILESTLKRKIIQASHDSPLSEVLEKLHADPREVLMEGPQGGGYATRVGM